MDIAFLFDSDDPELGGWYGYTVLVSLLDTGVLQAAKRPLRVSVGDILTYLAVAQEGGRTTDLQKLNSKVYVSEQLDLLFRRKLDQVLSNGTVYCWLFQNMTRTVTSQMHEKLARFPFYLGAMAVDFSYEPHLRFFRNSLIESYRFLGSRVSIFFGLDGNENQDAEIKRSFRESWIYNRIRRYWCKKKYL